MIEQLLKKYKNQEELAKALEVSRITVNRWLNRRQNPSKKNLKKIVDLEDMIEGYQKVQEWYPAIGQTMYPKNYGFTDRLYSRLEKLINNIINWKMNR